MKLCQTAKNGNNNTNISEACTLKYDPPGTVFTKG